MGIVRKDTNDTGPTTAKEILARLICKIRGHEIKNFKCTKCGAKFQEIDWQWSDPPPLPPQPENYDI